MNPQEDKEKPVQLIWERLATEDDHAWDAFKQFRDAVPPRRQRSVIGHGTCPVSHWYNEHRWVERVDAYDRHMERVAQSEREAQLRQNAKDVSAEHMAMLQSARHVAQRELDKLRESVVRGDGQMMRPTEIIRLLETVVKLDRLVRGESTEAVEVGNKAAKLTDEELEAIEKIQNKLKDS